VTDVRGLGLMAALQLDTPERAGDVVQRAFRRGLLLLTAGSRAVRLCPPLVLSPAEADVGLEILGEAVADCAAAERTAVRGSAH
jgi:4-aminobutyrate aminotransferase